MQADLAAEDDPLTRNKLEILSKLGDASAPATRPRIRLAYQLTPHQVVGADRVTGIEFTVTGTDEVRLLDAGLVLTSIGYRGKPIRDLPFDETAAVVPNDGGRVVHPGSGQPVHGSYVAGWIKRGPTGFIGTNKSCALQTVQNLVADYNAGVLTDPNAKPAALDKLVRDRSARRRRRRGMECHRRRRDRARRRRPAARQVHRRRRHAGGRGDRAARHRSGSGCWQPAAACTL